MKILQYDEVKVNKNALLSMISLNEEEFRHLLPFFEEAYNEKHRNISHAGRKAILLSMEDKLFFILFYMKNYPLQENIAYLFNMSQSQANEWIHRLSGILEQALLLSGNIPDENGKSLGITSNKVKKNFVIDGTERPVQRPIDNETQEKYYSGKKKRHTVNNIIIVDMENRNIDFISDTYVGPTHDKTICDEENIVYPEESTICKDKGFEGYSPDGVEIIAPTKKPKNGELSQEEKDNNSIIASIRIVVEHVISGVKRCHIVKAVFRNTKLGYDHLVFKIACGLHNFRNQYRNVKCT